MPKVYNDFVLISRDVSVDVKENMLSVFKIIERFNFSVPEDEFKKYEDAVKTKGTAASFPVACSITSSWSLDNPSESDKEFTLLIKVVGPDGVEAGELNHRGVVKQGNDKIGFSGTIDTLPVTKAGQYTLHHILSHKSKPVAEGFCRFKVLIEKESLKKT